MIHVYNILMFCVILQSVPAILLRVKMKEFAKLMVILLSVNAAMAGEEKPARSKVKT